MLSLPSFTSTRGTLQVVITSRLPYPHLQVVLQVMSLSRLPCLLRIAIKVTLPLHVQCPPSHLTLCVTFPSKFPYSSFLCCPHPLGCVALHVAQPLHMGHPPGSVTLMSTLPSSSHLPYPSLPTLPLRLL